MARLDDAKTTKGETMSEDRLAYLGMMDAMERRDLAERARTRARRAERIAREQKERLAIDTEGQNWRGVQRAKREIEMASCEAIAAIETRRILEGGYRIQGGARSTR